MTKTCLTVFIVLLCTIYSATPFLNGAYAQYDLGPGALANIGTLKAKLLQGRYNAVKMSVSDTDLYGLQSILNTLGSDVKTILEDNYWDPALGNGKVGIHSLTYGNYLKMEAEYMYTFNDTTGAFSPDRHTTTLDSTGMGNIYNYIFAHQESCGERLDTGTYSNQYAWVCSNSMNHIPGKALSNPRFRWMPPDRLPYEDYTVPRSIGYDLKFHHSGIRDNKLYLTVAMKFDSLAVGAEVATIRLKVLNNVAPKWEYVDYTGDDNNYVEFELHPVNSEVDTTIYNNTYSSVPRDDDEYGNNYLFEYYIVFPDPNTASFSELMRSGADDYFLHINPEVIWHGNGRMEIDYIVLEDEYHRQVNTNRHDDSMYSWLQVRMNQILSTPNSSNIIYYYTKDEPFQGNFSMYDKIESHLEGVYGTEYSPKLITAIHPEGSKIVKNSNGDTYEHYLHFLAQAKPRTIAVDPYPLREGSTSDLILWNNEYDSRFVQQRIDSILTKTYKNLAHAVRHNSDLSVRDTDIIYIPQTFGEYVSNANGVDHWGFFKPPRNMNKCLQLLPLCYSADGILDFALLAESNQLYGSVYRLAPLMHEDGYENIHVPPFDSAFERLTEANEKIAVYGPYLQSLNWQDAECLMTYGGADGVSISPFLLSELRVQDPDSPVPRNPPVDYPNYDGYVQCGYYNDNQQFPSFMLVNRRAVYKQSNDNTVVQLPVDYDFVDTSNQTVVFVPSTGAETNFGNHIGLYDPFDGQIYGQEGTDIRVSIGPGDGKMLEMCGTLPPQVSTDITMRNKVYLSGEISITDNCEVNIDPNTKVEILPNTHFILSSGSDMTLKGTITAGDGVRFTIADDAQVYISNGSFAFQGDLLIDGGGSFTIGDSIICSYAESSNFTISDTTSVIASGSHNFNRLTSIQVIENSSLTFQNAEVSLKRFSDISTNLSYLGFINS